MKYNGNHWAFVIFIMANQLKKNKEDEEISQMWNVGEGSVCNPSLSFIIKFVLIVGEGQLHKKRQLFLKVVMFSKKRNPLTSEMIRI